MKKIILVELVILSILVTLLTGVVGYACIREVWLPSETEEVYEILVAHEPTDEITIIEEYVDDSWLGNVDFSRKIASGLFFVYDVSKDQFIVSSHGPDERVYPASVTKLVTTLVVLEYLDPEELITAGDELDMLDPDSSLAGIQKGDILSAAQLVEAMLLPSGNDAAHIAAAAVGEKLLNDPAATPEAAVAAFMGEMNRRAGELGMTSSHFVTPDGIHDGEHYTTVANLSLLGRLALNNVLLRSYTSLPTGNNPRYDEALAQPDGPRQWINTNALIHPSSPYYCPYAIGLKTGQTNAAGICLLSAFRYKREYYIIGVFRGTSSEDRFADSQQLFAQYIYGTR